MHNFQRMPLPVYSSFHQQQSNLRMMVNQSSNQMQQSQHQRRRSNGGMGMGQSFPRPPSNSLMNTSYESKVDHFGPVGPQNLPKGNGGFGHVFVRQPEEVGPRGYQHGEHLKVKSEKEEVNESKHSERKWIKIENSSIFNWDQINNNQDSSQSHHNKLGFKPFYAFSANNEQSSINDNNYNSPSPPRPNRKVLAKDRNYWPKFNKTYRTDNYRKLKQEFRKNRDWSPRSSRRKRTNVRERSFSRSQSSDAHRPSKRRRMRSKSRSRSPRRSHRTSTSTRSKSTFKEVVDHKKKLDNEREYEIKRLEYVKKREERVEREEKELLRNFKIKEEEKQVKMLKKERLDREKRLHEREKKLREMKEERERSSSRQTKFTSRSRTRTRSRSRSRRSYKRSRTCNRDRSSGEGSTYNQFLSKMHRSKSQYKKDSGDEKSTRVRSKSQYRSGNANRVPLGRRRSRSVSNSSQMTCSTNRSVFDSSRLGSKVSVRHRLGKRKRSRSRSSWRKV